MCIRDRALSEAEADAEAAQLGLSQPSPVISRMGGTTRAKPGASVLVLGGGVAGLSAAIRCV